MPFTHFLCKDKLAAGQSAAIKRLDQVAFGKEGSTICLLGERKPEVTPNLEDIEVKVAQVCRVVRYQGRRATDGCVSREDET